MNLFLFVRFLLQLVGVLLDDIATKQVKVDMSEQQHTFYCQQLGTLLMCLIHIFKSGMHTHRAHISYVSTHKQDPLPA